MANGVRLTPKRGWGKPQTSGLIGAVGTDSTEEGDSSAPSGTPPGGSSSAASVHTPGSGGGQVKPVQPVSPKQTKGSGFTNVQRILKASGTESGPSRLAQSVVGGVQQAATGAQQGLAGAKQEFAGKIAPVQSSLEQAPTQATAIVEKAKSGQDVSGDVEAWKKLASGAYTGPTELSFSPQQTRQAAESAALSKLAGGVEGRSALLQKYVGSPQYGTSKQTLDALLLGKGGSSAIRGALRQGAKTEQEIAREQAVSKARAAALQQGFAGAAEEAKTKLGTASSEVIGGLEGTKTAESERIAGAVDRILNALRGGGGTISGGGGRGSISVRGPGGEPVAISAPTIGTVPTISRKDLSVLGLTEQQLNNLAAAYTVGIDPSQYLTGRSSEELKTYLQTLGKEQFATEADKAKIAALGSLSGQQNLGLSDLGAAYNLSNLSSYDINRLQTDFATKINEMASAEPYLPELGNTYGETVKIANTNRSNYLSGLISSQDFINNDPILTLATSQVDKLSKLQDDKGSAGMYSSGLANWTRILNERKDQLNSIVNATKSFAFTD
jgi:hypothetical protein